MPTPLPDRLSILSRLAQDFNASLDPDEVLHRVMDEVIAVTQAERGFLMLVEKNNQPTAEDVNALPLVCYIASGIDQSTLDSPSFVVSRSIVAQVAQSGQAVLTSDAQHDDRFKERESIMILRLRSILCVPLKVQQRVLGVIYVDNRIQAGIFTKDDLDLLLAIASNAAIAIENARLYQNTHANLRTLRLLHDISENLTSTLDLQHVLTISIEGVQELMAAKAASILILEEQDLVFKVAIGEKSETIKPFRIPATAGIAGWVVQHMQPVIVNDARSDTRFYQTLDQESGFVTETLLAVPLLVKDRAIGVIEVFNKPGGFSQNDRELLSTFASSAAFAIENARLYQLAIEKGRIERELQMARRVQLGLLPRQTPSLPGWEFAAHWLPARQVAGDYYDFIPLDHTTAPQQLGLLIGDVTDKGMPAALFMALARSTIRAALYSAHSPAEGIHHANTLIAADSPNSMFITLIYAQINPATSEVTYVNAGHNPPLVYHLAQPGQVGLFTRTGIPLGIDPEQEYTQRSVHLSVGDMVLLYTDGVTDALNAQEQEYGLARLQALFLAQAGQSAGDIITAIEQDLSRFIGGSDPFDDITLLLIRRI